MTDTARNFLVITCEHGGNRVPVPYRYLFGNSRTLLDSHRGFDPGALVMARTLAKKFRAPLLTSTVTRLVVDLNRSIGHRNLHMESIRALPAATRQEILEHHYYPYRAEAERLMAQQIARAGRVIHLACHSFTNTFNGIVRHADIGLLYDPDRRQEKALCARWKSVIRECAPDLEVRHNFPYRGHDDGLTTTLRKKFPADAYLGIELELNQKNLLPPVRQWAALRKSVIVSLDNLLMSFNL